MVLLSLVWIRTTAAEPQVPTARPPQGEFDRAQWLENMIGFHRYTADEVRAATGLGDDVIAEALKRWGAPEEAPAGSPETAGDRKSVV